MAIAPEQFRAAYKNAPRLVRNYLASGALDALMLGLSKKHGLHADTSGGVSEAITQLVLGLMDPQGFTKQLQWLGVSEAEAASIVQELNDQVFKPLQDKMREGGADEDTDAFLDNTEPEAPTLAAPIPTNPLPSFSVSAAASLPTWTPPPPAVRPAPAPRSVIVPPPVVSFGPLPAAVPVAATPVSPASVPVRAVAAPAPTQRGVIPQNLPGSEPPVPVPVMRTMQTDFPNGSPAAAPQPVSARPPVTFNVTASSAPSVSVQRASASAPQPKPVTEPQPRPAQESSQIPQFKASIPVPNRVPPASQPAAVSPISVTPQYGTDPYREPVE